MEQKEIERISEASPLFNTIESPTNNDPDDGHKNHHKTNSTQKSLVHIMFIAINIIAVVTSLSMILSQCLTILILSKETMNFHTCLEITLRVYVVLFCCILILSESNFEHILIRICESSFTSLDNWIFRGFLYSFIGMIGVEESYSLQGAHPFMEMFINISSFVMVCVGIVYVVMGLLCLKHIRDRVQEEFRLLKQCNDDENALTLDTTSDV